MYDLTGFQRDLLFAVASVEGGKGLEVKNELEDYYTSEINHGRLYPNLDTLTDKGLIDKSKQDERTDKYKLTPRGEREIQERRKWEEKRAEPVLVQSA